MRLQPLLTLLQTAAQKGFPLLLNLLDDILLAGLARVGISLPWLQWLSFVLLGLSLLYWSFRLIRFLSRKYRATFNSELQ